MAQLNQSKITITVSELIRDTDPVRPILDSETLEQLTAVLEQLVGNRVLIELDVE